jgi:aspartate/methionine/tyrosine aminotransferase
MKPAASVFANLGTTIFTTMSALAVEHGAINLGQGFPDGNGPDDVRARAEAYLNDRPNQYPPMTGVPELREAVAAHAQRFYGLSVDAEREVLVTSGATEALASCLLALIEPGDEVVMIEPLYDSYLPIVRRAGGIPRLVRLAPPDWALPRAELAAAFSPRTKLLILNSPMNPTGKVFTADELAFIAGLLQRHDAYAVCDEVYEHLVFDGRRHIPLMTLPGLRDRCLRIGSAGKTFSLTGWKVGYVTGAADLLSPVAKAHQFLTFTTPPNLQRAVAYGLQKNDAYFASLSRDLASKRDRLAAGLRRCGFDIMPTAGTYFICADIRSAAGGRDDVAFCMHLTRAVGVAAIPISAFYETAAPTHYVRFAFCKDDAVLDEAIRRLDGGMMQTSCAHAKHA